MKKVNIEKKMQSEFFEFLETSDIVPSIENDKAVMDRVASDLHPAPLIVYSKLTLIQSFSGLLTLTVCPQFGVGLGQHNEFLHSLHEMTTPVIFYLLCGVFFVILGAVTSGLILTRPEIRTIGNKKFFYFTVFGVLTYLGLVLLGAEVFVASSLVWILGALLGNVVGFEAVTRFRMTNA